MLAPRLQQFIQFATTGGLATGIQYLILLGLVEGLAVSPVLASAVGYAVSSLLNYLMKYHWVFTSCTRHTITLPRYALIAISGLLLNTTLLEWGLASTDWHYLLIQIGVTGLVLLWNFFANAYWTFAQRSK